MNIKVISALLGCLFAYSQLFAQVPPNINLLRNGSFEEEESADNGELPNDLGQVYGKGPQTNKNKHCKYWETRQKYKTKNNAYGQQVDYLLHSPDWFNDGIFWDGNTPYYHVLLGEILPNGANSKILAQEGTHYVGMAPGELIQQKFNWAIEEGEDYILEFYVRTVNNSAYGVPVANIDATTPFTLRAGIAKGEMKYKHNDIDGRCDDDWGDHKSNIEYGLINLSVSAATHPPHEWHKVTTTFTAPTTGALSGAYKWFVMELIPTQNGKTCSQYVLIDDLRLSRGCLNGCSSTDGFYNSPVTTSTISTGSYWEASGLDNYKSASLTVWDIPGQVVLLNQSFACTNGINGSFVWDGRSSGGGQMAPGYYPYELTVVNDCGPMTFSGKILKISDYPGFASTIFDPCYNGGIVVPEPCCLAEPNIWLDNLDYWGPGSLEYRMINGIYIATASNHVQVHYNADVKCYAGAEIVMEPGFSVDPGGVFLAQIEECTYFNRYANPKGDKDPVCMESPGTEAEKEDMETQAQTPESTLESTGEVVLYPNPNSGRFTIDLNAAEKAHVAVYDLQGRNVASFEVYQREQFDLSSHPDGVYFVRVRVNDTVTVIKMVKGN